MKVLSLFDGMSCDMIAFRQLGIPVDEYHAYEIDKVKTNGEPKYVYPVKNGKITVNGREYPIKLDDGMYVIRKLTVRECARLQTIPEWYNFSVISNSRAYKCLGNGWTVEVITHLIEQAMQGKTEESYIQLGLF